MTIKDGLPCKRCGTAKWYKSGGCVECTKSQANGWYAKHKQHVSSRLRTWYANNKEVSDKRRRKYIAENPGKVKQIQRRWFAKNPDKARAYKTARNNRKRGAGGQFTFQEWQALCNHYGNKCLRCGRTNVPLSADHIKPVSKGGDSYIDNIQPLCKSCNSIKGARHIDYRPDANPLRWVQATLFG